MSASPTTDGAPARSSELLTRLGGLARRYDAKVVRRIDERVAALSAGVGSDGVDPFGFDPEVLRRAALVAGFLYEVYFRVEARGLDNLPAGPFILAANHGGQLPFDGLMIATALLLEAEPVRLARPQVDRFVQALPFISTLYARLGVTLGAHENALRLLERQEVLLTFPEGVRAITKTIDRAYELQEFGLGFIRLALEARVPVVPVAVVGAEEQYPTVATLTRPAKLLGLPALPLWLQLPLPLVGLLPLPVKYHLEFGEPLTFEGDPDDEDRVVRVHADAVKARLRGLLDQLRASRRSIFW